MHKTFMAILVTSIVVIAGCSSDTDSDSTAATVEPMSTESGIDNSEVETVVEAEPTEPAQVMPIDRLLPDEVFASYVPSYPVDDTIVDAKARSTFPPLENIRPKECEPLIKLATTPIADDTGELVGAAWNSVYTRDPATSLGPTYRELLWAYASEGEAATAFANAVALIGDCKTASAEWPQQGSITIGDGYNRENFDIGKVRSVSESVVIMDGKTDYTGDIRNYSALALAGDSVLWLELDAYGNLTGKRVKGIFDQFVNDSLQYALTGEVSSTSDLDSNVPVTLDCLEISPLPYKLQKNYSEFYGPGRGDDLFVETRGSVTNNCGKRIKGFKYDVSFVDDFGDEVLSGNGTVKKAVAPGATQKTPSNTGFTIRRAFDAEDIKTFVTSDEGDISVNFSITQILFSDGSSLP